MKVVVLYHPASDHARAVEEFAHDFQRLHGAELELMSLETIAGAARADLYGVMSYPAVLAVREDGELVQVWASEHLPLMNEVAAYINA
jgi:hypothetical protein